MLLERIKMVHDLHNCLVFVSSFSIRRRRIISIPFSNWNSFDTIDSNLHTENNLFTHTRFKIQDSRVMVLYVRIDCINGSYGDANISIVAIKSNYNSSSSSSNIRHSHRSCVYNYILWPSIELFEFESIESGINTIFCRFSQIKSK